MKGNYKLALALVAGVAIAAFSVFSPLDAQAQEKQKYSFKSPPSATKYEEQHAIDVGDVPGHQVRVYSLHSVYTDEAPVYDGVKVKESWTRASSDYTEGNGRTQGYTIADLENGDKVFGRLEGITQTTVGADGSKVAKTNVVTTLTGGTGKFKGIHGTLRTVATTDFKTYGGNVAEGEYWIETGEATGTSTSPTK
jgi:hypothetical protein